MTRATERAVAGRSGAVIAIAGRLDGERRQGDRTSGQYRGPTRSGRLGRLELAGGPRALRARAPDTPSVRDDEPLRARLRPLRTRHGDVRPVRSPAAAARISLVRPRVARRRSRDARPESRDDDRQRTRRRRDGRTRLSARGSSLRRAHGKDLGAFHPHRRHVLGVRRGRLSVHAPRRAHDPLRAPLLARPGSGTVAPSPRTRPRRRVCSVGARDRVPIRPRDLPCAALASCRDPGDDPQRGHVCGSRRGSRRSVGLRERARRRRPRALSRSREHPEQVRRRPLQRLRERTDRDLSKRVRAGPIPRAWAVLVDSPRGDDAHLRRGAARRDARPLAHRVHGPVDVCATTLLCLRPRRRVRLHLQHAAGTRDHRGTRRDRAGEGSAHAAYIEMDGRRGGSGKRRDVPVERHPDLCARHRATRPRDRRKDRVSGVVRAGVHPGRDRI